LGTKENDIDVSGQTFQSETHVRQLLLYEFKAIQAQSFN